MALIGGGMKRYKYLFPHVFLYLRLAQRSLYAYKEPLNVAKIVLTWNLPVDLTNWSFLGQAGFVHFLFAECNRLRFLHEIPVGFSLDGNPR